MNYDNILKENNLKVTPQRIAVLEALDNLKMHPSTEEICGYIRDKYPSIAMGTIYKILDLMVEKRMISKVKTDRDIMRYDSVKRKHHHLYERETGEVIDYFDDDLDSLLSDYFSRKEIPGFRIDDVRLQISGKKSISNK